MTSDDGTPGTGGLTYNGVTYYSTGVPKQSATPLEICPDCAGSGELFSRTCPGCNGRGMFLRHSGADSAA
jgi:DnaJ-class molecular chaperone